MTRAGRRQFGYDQSGRSSEVEHTLKTNKEESNTADIKGFVEKNLATKTAIDEDELVDLIRDDIGSAIDELRDDGKAKYSASEGGWLRVVNDE
ncbi:DUF5805 domain-containing protein [Halococcus salifodinae]|uniref:Uncharacterized protein n=1 Tax=Halococcus salifodinae DSM 8989 TaxID=1227456 RepID=M0ND94_9EURY|nr:DUF5805 domain-containing protein [Halococcus salifodinae]EMA54660.1 hypothetical protein C450_05180 [Halococcus salifodinae DSM 8989]